MHTAPTVTYPVGRSRARSVAFSGVWLLALALTLGFVVEDGASLRALFLAVAALSAYGMAWRRHREVEAGRLAWDGVTWWWEPTVGHRIEGRVVPCLDVQSVVLVHFAASAGQGRWLWLEQSAAPLVWGRLRCALMQPPARQDAAGAMAGASAGPCS